MESVRPASVFGMRFNLMEESFHPPALDAGDEEEEIPWVLLEDEAYVADRRNATTAYSDCWCGGMIQASLFVARPPRLSYICVFYRCQPAAAGEEPQADEEEKERQEQMFPMEPEVIATDESLVLLRIAVGDLNNGFDWYVYQPGGDGGPLLTRLERPPDDDAFHPPWFGLVSCHASRRDDHDSGPELPVGSRIFNASQGGLVGSPGSCFFNTSGGGLASGPGSRILNASGVSLASCEVGLASGPGRRILNASGVSLASCEVGLASCTSSRRGDHRRGLSLLRPDCAPQDDKFYMVAALCHERPTIAKGRFVLYLYNSKIRTWTTTKVSVEDQQYQKYQDHGYFFHLNSKVIVVGGEDATIAFVDLWRGILLCDLSHIKEKPWLRYVPLPERERTASFKGEALLSRDIAVINGEFKYVKQLLRRKPCPFSRGHDIRIGWVCKMFTRPVFASSPSDDSWEPVYSTESSEMDIESSPDFHLLPRLEDDEGRPLPPFKGIEVSQPMLGLDSDNTVCLMVNNDGKAWVMNVDLKNNRLRLVKEFDFTRYARVGIAYKHSRISRYLKNAQGTKENLKRKGMLLLPGSTNKKVPWWGGEAATEGMVEDGDDMLLE